MSGHIARRVKLGLALYGAMIGLAVAIAWWREDSLWEQPAVWPAGLPHWLVANEASAMALSVTGGALLAVATILSTRVLVRRTAWARALRAEFRASLEGASDRDIILLALASGVAEELLFRGALQPALGVVLTSILFGAVHFVPTRRLAPWSVWAGVMGLLLGLLYDHAGSIAGCVLAHVAINAVNLRMIVRHDPSLDDATSPHAPPALVGRKRVRRSDA
jgi:membrane protease YdiL (CAAX protease family)